MVIGKSLYWEGIEMDLQEAPKEVQKKLNEEYEGATIYESGIPNYWTIISSMDDERGFFNKRTLKFEGFVGVRSAKIETSQLADGLKEQAINAFKKHSKPFELSKEGKKAPVEKERGVWSACVFVEGYAKEVVECGSKEEAEEMVKKLEDRTSFKVVKGEQLWNKAEGADN